MRCLFRVAAFCLVAAVVSGLAAAPDQADEFTIYLRARDGEHLEGAQIRAFEMVGKGAVLVEAGQAQATIRLGEALTDVLTSPPKDPTKPLGVPIKIRINVPDAKFIAFVANRKDQPATVIVPFIACVGGQKHQLFIAL